VWLAGRVLYRQSFAVFGFQLHRHWWRDCGFALFLGALLLELVFAIERAAGWHIIADTPQPAGAAPSLAPDVLLFGLVCLAAGVAEETLYRGYWIRHLAKGLRGRAINVR
jgi:membrane protease YdiL (CAAX protease family)